MSWLTKAACHIDLVNSAVNQLQAYGCLDFWLNRYQSLIGNALTLIVAIAAARLLLRQIRQGENAVRRESARARSSMLKSKLDRAVRDHEVLQGALTKYCADIRGSDTLQLLIAFEALLNSLEQIIDVSSAASAIPEMHLQKIAAKRNLLNSCDRLKQHLKDIESLADRDPSTDHLARKLTLNINSQPKELWSQIAKDNIDVIQELLGDLAQLTESVGSQVRETEHASFQ